MVVGIFTDSYLPVKNGVVTSIRILKAGLEDHGHRVFVFAPSHPHYESAADTIRLPSIPVGRGTEVRYALVNRKRVRRIVQELNVDLIHCHSEFAVGQAGKDAGRQAGIPVVHTNHTMWEMYQHYLPLHSIVFAIRSVKTMLRNRLAGIKFFVSPSIKAKQYYQQLADSDATFEIIPNGLDAAAFERLFPPEEAKNKARQELGITKEDAVGIFVGRIGPEKRVIELLSSLKPVFKRFPDFKMLYVGDGPDKPRLEAMAHEAGLKDRVLFTGFVDWSRIPTFLSISRVFLTLSLSEVHPMTVIEAATIGLPVIARKDDAYVMMVHDGKNGYLIETDTELPDRLQAVLSDNSAWTQFSQHSIEVAHQFSAEAHVDRMLGYYGRILDQTTTGGSEAPATQ